MDFKSRITIEYYKNQKISHLDFRKLSGDDFINMLNASRDYVVKNTDLLILIDVTGSSIFGKVVDEAKKFSRIIKPHRKKTALLGVEGAKKVLLQSILFFSGGFTPQVKTFDTKEDALEWLIKP